MLRKCTAAGAVGCLQGLEGKALKHLDGLFGAVQEEEDLNLPPHVRFDSNTTFIYGT